MPFDGAGWKESNRLRLARESLTVLDLLERRLEGGNGWIQNSYFSPKGVCIVGGLQAIRARRVERDRAGVYLSRAITDLFGLQVTIEDFNDTRFGYEDVAQVIVRAKERAQAVVECEQAR